MEFLKATTRAEAARLLSKIHSQPAVAADIAAGRYDRYCAMDLLLAAPTGEIAIPVDARRGDSAMWATVLDGEEYGEIDVARSPDGETIINLTWRARQEAGPV